MQLSEHFNSNEFRCKCGKCEQTVPPKELINVLEDVRQHFGKPVTIMSGYRCEQHNKNVGGAPRSKHKLGIAADIQIKDVLPKTVYSYLADKYPDKYGIGSYTNFTHVDIRFNKARW